MLYALHDHPLLQPRGDMDTSAYVALAMGSSSQPYFVSPLYLYFLRMFDGSLIAVRIAQIFLGGLAVVLIFDTARCWFGDRAATIAGVLSILTGVISFYEVTILQAALDPFLVALTLSLLTHALQTNDLFLFATAGCAAGLFVLNRPNAILWLPVLVFCVAAGFGPRFSSGGLKPASTLMIAFLATIAPVTIRNYVVAHRFVLISSQGGLNFYIGNNADADGTYHHVPGIRPTIAGQQEDAPRVEAAQGPFSARAWNWIRSDPAAALLLFVRKVAYTFNQTDLALNYSYSYFRQDVDSPLRWLIVGPWLLFPLGIVGAFRSLTDRRFAIWATFIPVYALSVALFFVSSRYRLPLLVPMCMTASALSVRPRVYEWIAAAVLMIGVCWNFGLDDGRAHERTNMAVYLIEQHRFDDADRLIASTETITRDPATLHLRSAEAYQHEGIALVQADHADAALRAFQSANRFDPSDASNLLNMAVLEAQRNDLVTAREHARAALRLHPGYTQAQGLLQALDGR